MRTTVAFADIGDFFYQPLQAVGRARRRVGGHAQRDLGGIAGQRAAALRTQTVAGQVAGDLPQPGQEAGGAAQLVQLLQDAPQWRKVNLPGVLQADGAGSGRDRFTLTAELQPVLVAPAAAPAAPAKEAADADAKRTP